MANLKLSLAMAMNPRARPVLEGAVRPDGIDLARDRKSVV